MPEKEVRLIDANALKEQISNDIYRYWNCSDGGYYLAEDVLPVIDGQEAINPESLRPHGKWVKADDDDGIVCSCCGVDFCTLTNETEHFDFCPGCGAKMEVGYEDDFDLYDLDYDRCWECGAYGDDYRMDDNGEWVCNCNDCPYNGREEE